MIFFIAWSHVKMKSLAHFRWKSKDSNPEWRFNKYIDIHRYTVDIHRYRFSDVSKSFLRPYFTRLSVLLQTERYTKQLNMHCLCPSVCVRLGRCLSWFGEVREDTAVLGRYFTSWMLADSGIADCHGRNGVEWAERTAVFLMYRCVARPATYDLFWHLFKRIQT